MHRWVIRRDLIASPIYRLGLQRLDKFAQLKKSSTIETSGYTMVKPGVILGLSPGNSFYKQETVRDLTRWVSSEYGGGHVLVPEAASVSTFAALGSTRPEKRAREASRRLYSAARYSGLCLHGWGPEYRSWISTAPYLAYRQQIQQLFNNNSAFRLAALEETRKVVEGKTTLSDLTEATNIGVQYIIDEFAIVRAYPTLMGRNDLVILYHKPWKLLEDFQNGVYDKHPYSSDTTIYGGVALAIVSLDPPIVK